MSNQRRNDETLSLVPTGVPATQTARVVVGDGREKALLTGQGVVVGKGSVAELRLDDPHVSRTHVRLTMTDGGVRVEDLGSRNGTLLNGVPVKLVVISDSAVLTVGRSNLRLEFGESRGERSAFGGAIGSSPAMQQVFAILEKLAPSEVSILLTGETGTGKDVFARATHGNSARAAAPLAVFDCGAVAANLIESDLFGHEKGAFTGATSVREGVFERGNGGTVFLDEIGELPLELQPRLLRVLEQREVTRVGGESSRSIDVRVLAATNRDLEAEVEAGRFRRDLFFRLGAAVVAIPPLRERKQDIPALVTAQLEELGAELLVSAAVLEAFASYDWPGNVRELKNVVASAVALADGPSLEPRHLMFFRRRDRDGARAQTLDSLPLAGRTLEVLERSAIKQTLEQVGGNKAKAARELGIASSTLYEKIKKYGL